MNKIKHAFNIIYFLLYRFPDTDLLAAFSILGMRPLTFLSEDELESYGDAEVDTLCHFYGEQQKVCWKDDHNIEHENTSEPYINSQATKKEWKLVKLIVKAESYPRDCLWKLWHLIAMYHSADFPNLIKLSQLALTSAVHTAGCERGFSIQNQLLTKGRNRLSIDKQDKLMRVRLSPFSRSELADETLPVLKNTRERRLYTLKCC